MKLNYRMLGKRIRGERKFRKLTQEQLAERVDRSPSFIGLIERGERRMSVETLYEIAIALECSTDVLLGIELNQTDRFAGARELLAIAQAIARREA